MRQRRKNHQLLALAKRIPIDLRFEVSFNNAAQIRMRLPERPPCATPRSATNAGYVRVRREPAQQLAAAVTGSAKDNGVDLHATRFRCGRIFSSTSSANSFACVRAFAAGRPNDSTKRVPTRLSVAGPLTTSMSKPKAF